MNILVLAPQPFFQNRGTPIAVRMLLEVLASEGHALDLLAYHEGEDVDIPGCTIHRIPKLPGLRGIRPGPSWKKIVADLLMIFKCLRMVRSKRWHLIHAVEESVFIAMIMKRLFGVPYIYDMDSCMSLQLVEKYPILRPLRGMLRFFERRAVRGSQGVVAACRSLEDQAIEYSSSTPVVRVEDVSLLHSREAAEDFESDILESDARVIMYVGNLESYQGIDLLLESFVHLVHRRHNVRLIVIGGTRRDVQKYRQRARDYAVADRAHFLGSRPVEQLGHYLDRADVLVSPRIHGNNTPMKLFSYLDSGKPVLATRLSTHTQVLDDRTAYLVDPNPLAMASGMEELISDHALSHGLAEHARNRIAREYTREVLRGKLTMFYEELEESLSNGTKLREQRN